MKSRSTIKSVVRKLPMPPAAKDAPKSIGLPNKAPLPPPTRKPVESAMKPKPPMPAPVRRPVESAMKPKPPMPAPVRRPVESATHPKPKNPVAQIGHKNLGRPHRIGHGVRGDRPSLKGLYKRIKSR